MKVVIPTKNQTTMMKIPAIVERVMTPMSLAQRSSIGMPYPRLTRQRKERTSRMRTISMLMLPLKRMSTRPNSIVKILNIRWILRPIELSAILKEKASLASMLRMQNSPQILTA